MKAEKTSLLNFLPPYRSTHRATSRYPSKDHVIVSYEKAKQAYILGSHNPFITVLIQQLQLRHLENISGGVRLYWPARLTCSSQKMHGSAVPIVTGINVALGAVVSIYLST